MPPIIAKNVWVSEECNKLAIPKYTKKQTNIHKKKSLTTTPIAKKEPVLYPNLIPVLMSAKNAGPNEKVRSITIMIA